MSVDDLAQIPGIFESGRWRVTIYGDGSGRITYRATRLSRFLRIHDELWEASFDDADRKALINGLTDGGTKI